MGLAMTLGLGTNPYRVMVVCVFVVPFVSGHKERSINSCRSVV